jgi:hypothetical protein
LGPGQVRNLGQRRDALAGEDGPGIREWVLLTRECTQDRSGRAAELTHSRSVHRNGYVQSLAFTPGPDGPQNAVVVRFAFDAGPGGPPLADMDRITHGIRSVRR